MNKRAEVTRNILGIMAMFLVMFLIFTGTLKVSHQKPAEFVGTGTVSSVKPKDKIFSVAVITDDGKNIHPPGDQQYIGVLVLNSDNIAQGEKIRVLQENIDWCYPTDNQLMRQHSFLVGQRVE